MWRCMAREGQAGATGRGKRPAAPRHDGRLPPTLRPTAPFSAAMPAAFATLAFGIAFCARLTPGLAREGFSAFPALLSFELTPFPFVHGGFWFRRALLGRLRRFRQAYTPVMLPKRVLGLRGCSRGSAGCASTARARSGSLNCKRLRSSAVFGDAVRFSLLGGAELCPCWAVEPWGRFMLLQ